MGSTAYGKVILIGEHAVVYGVPAIVVGIGHGATARATRGQGSSEVVVRAPGLSVTARAGDGTDLGAALSALLEVCAVRGAVRVEASADIPAAAGLGCSAAIGVAVTRALDALEGRPAAEPDDVAARTMAWERVFHGNPSGVDAAAAARGGCLVYQRGAAIERIALARSLVLAIGRSGVASSTRPMVEHIAALRRHEPERVQQALNEIRALSQQARGALETGDLATVGRAMDDNQRVLSALGLSIAQTDALCAAAREQGALGVKLTGSGGGGCVVALCASSADDVVARWSKDGYDAFATVVAANAVDDRSCAQTE